MKHFAAFTLFFFCCVSAAVAGPPYVAVSPGEQQICAINSENVLECDTEFFATRLLPPSDIGPVAAVSVGDTHACALQLDNQIRCWGDNFFGQLDIPDSGNTYVKISAGANHTCAIDEMGAVSCWGLNTDGQASPPDTVRVWRDVEAGRQHSCGLDDEGRAHCWPAERANLSPVPAGLPAFEAIDISPLQACGLSFEGSLHCWGAGPSAPEGGPYTDVALAHGMICGIRADGQSECAFSTLLLPDAAADFDDTVTSHSLATISGVISDNTISNRSGGCGIDLEGGLICWGVPPELTSAGSVLPVPFDLQALVYSDSTAEVTWRTEFNRPFSAFRRQGYEVQVNDNEPLFTENDRSLVLEGLNPAEEYRVRIRLVDSTGQVGEYSEAVLFSTAGQSGPGAQDYQPPFRAAKPSGLEIRVYGATTAEILWNRPENVFLQGYELYRNDEYIGFTPGVSYIDNENDSVQGQLLPGGRGEPAAGDPGNEYYCG